MPTLFDIMFYLFGVVTVVSAVFTCFAKNIVYAAFSLLFTFFGVAGLYILLSADFLAVSQLMIYVGGILVLIVFGVMLTNRTNDLSMPRELKRKLPAAIVTLALLFVVLSITLTTKWTSVKEQPWASSPWKTNAVEQAVGQEQGSVREVLDRNGSQGTSLEIGKLLMTDYALPFELVSIVLLVALIGAAMIARREPETSEDDGELRLSSEPRTIEMEIEV
jgi:NADH-quinone oxidoreductase subunit J